MTTFTKDDTFRLYEIAVESYKRERDPDLLACLLEVQKVYNGYGWCEVYEIDGEGIPHYKVKEGRG